MVQDQSNNTENVPPSSVEFGGVRNDSESFRTVPQASESFGKLRNDSERFGTVPHLSERKENHSLSVREAARMFEAAGVARTERSITNWCQPNRAGVARLDAYFDPNERKYFITPQSVELAIGEEKAKAAKLNDPAEAFGKAPQGSEAFRTVPHTPEKENKTEPTSEGDKGRMLELERENLDLKITNRAKDIHMERMQKEREVIFDQLLAASRKMGELETKLLQLESPRN
jgi:hypothetical protein